jgi:hypothetical protein
MINVVGDILDRRAGEHGRPIVRRFDRGVVLVFASYRVRGNPFVTINIAVAVAEGLVMAADSWTQMSDSAGNVSTTHSSTEKVTELGNRHIAVMIHGLGSIQNRSILSLIREFEFVEYGKKPCGIDAWTVHESSSKLAEFIESRYSAQFPPPAAGVADVRMPLGLVVGGFSPGQFFPEVVEIRFPGPTVERVHPDANLAIQPTGGWYVDFWGVRSSLKRLLYGFDLEALEVGFRFLEWAENERNGGRTDLGHIPPPPSLRPADAIAPLGPFQTINHRLDGMPLQEAVEFADFLGTVAIGYDKFSKGQRSVGGDLDVLAIQADGLFWYRRKSFADHMAKARDGRRRL